MEKKYVFVLLMQLLLHIFIFNIGNLRNFKVVSKDGIDVQPVTVNEILIGIAETYDIIFEIPHNTKTFEAKATAQDITGSASLMFGTGEIEKVPDKIKPSPYEMSHGDHNFEGGEQHGDHNFEGGGEQHGDHNSKDGGEQHGDHNFEGGGEQHGDHNFEGGGEPTW